ncbi:hypothetical protein BS78_01G089000 [Paspalum vaginatum]|nr:hypothetical protein BS78_01G089000 [Paspalum vaginatum]
MRRAHAAAPAHASASVKKTRVLCPASSILSSWPDSTPGSPSPRTSLSARLGAARAARRGARDGMIGDHTGSGDWRARHADFPGWGVCGCRGRIVGTPNSPVLSPPSSTPAKPGSAAAADTLSPLLSAPHHGSYYPRWLLQFSLPSLRLPRRSLLLRSPAACAEPYYCYAGRAGAAMNILNQPINPGGHPVFPAAKESGHPTPASVRFDGVPAQPSTAAAGRAHAHCPRWQAQTLRRASSHVGVEHDGGPAAVVPDDAVPAPFKPITLDFLRSFLDRNCAMSAAVADMMSSAAVADSEASAPPPPPPPASPPQLLALRVVVTSAVELDARQTELIARKMRRLTGFVNLTVENVVDPSLIAGFVICYGIDDSHVIDLSVKGKLAALKNRVDSIDQTAHAHGHPYHWH